MGDLTTLAERFEGERRRLRLLAYRMLGNTEDAQDAVQEAWLRLSTANANEIENLSAWLTTVVSRICLNALRARQRRGPPSMEDVTADLPLADVAALTPEDQAVLADTMGAALLVVLEVLSPVERIAFVLHDVFSLPFEEIAPILGKSEAACRQLASRARRRVRTAQDPTADPERQREVVDAFLRASKSGDLTALLSLLSPAVELVADAAAAAMGAPEHLEGADAVASLFSGGARAARTALLDGLAGLVWAQGGATRVAFDFTVADDSVTRIEMIADAEVLEELRIEPLGRGGAR